MMKSKLSAALPPQGACWLLTPATAISVTLNHCGATTSSVQAAVLFEDLIRCGHDMRHHHRRAVRRSNPRNAAATGNSSSADGFSDRRQFTGKFTNPALCWLCLGKRRRTLHNELDINENLSQNRLKRKRRQAS